MPSSGDRVSALSGLQVMASWKTPGRRLRTRSTTAALSGLAPERASEITVFTPVRCRSVSINRSVVGTATQSRPTAATAPAA